MKQKQKTKLRPIPDIPSKAALLALPKQVLKPSVVSYRLRWSPEEDQQVMARHNVNCFDAVTDALADRVYDYP